MLPIPEHSGARVLIVAANRDKRCHNPDLTGWALSIQDLSWVVSKNKDWEKPLEALLVFLRLFVSFNIKNVKTVQKLTDEELPPS